VIDCRPCEPGIQGLLPCKVCAVDVDAEPTNVPRRWRTKQFAHLCLSQQMHDGLKSRAKCRCIVMPILHVMRRRTAERVKRQRQEELQAAAQKALAQQAMMRPLIRRNAADERRTNGLIILQVCPGPHCWRVSASTLDVGHFMGDTARALAILPSVCLWSLLKMCTASGRAPWQGALALLWWDAQQQMFFFFFLEFGSCVLCILQLNH
jgi:hypothetical protein